MVDERWEREAKNGTPATHPLSGRDYASYAAISGKARNRHRCLPRTWGAAIQRPASPAWSSAQSIRPIWASRPHAAPCLRLQARQRWPRHARDPSLSRASQHSEHDALTPPGRRIGLRNFFAIESAWIADHERAAAPFLPQKYRAECQTLLVEPETAADSFFLQPTGSTHRRSRLVHCGGIRFELI
jgi:hypothetical protein